MKKTKNGSDKNTIADGTEKELNNTNKEDKSVSDKKLKQPIDKANRPLIVALVTLIIIAIGLGSAIIYLNNSKVSNDIVAVVEEEPIEHLDITIPNNGLSDFDLAFIKIENKKSNMIYSPLSIKYALAMLADGASGESKEQITKVIGNYNPKAYMNSSNRSLANAMFINDDIADAVKDTYIDTLKTKYNASVVFDPFTSSKNIDKWVSDKTLGIIDKAPFDVSDDINYVLMNALAIDMNWNYQLQCTITSNDDENKPISCLDKSRGGSGYYVNYSHEKYRYGISMSNGKTFEKVHFGNKDNVNAAEIGVSVNRYDIINDLGEDNIRDTVQREYEAWLENTQGDTEKYDLDFDIEKYMSELAENYGQFKESTDFYYNVSDDEIVFAKDLREYDGATLQYVGIMPKNVTLSKYVGTLTAEKADNLIKGLKDVTSIDNYKEGVITKIKAYIPLFKFDYKISNLADDLNALGINDVFSSENANLSNMLEYDESSPEKPSISEAAHKANIDFSNDGIKAAAVTFVGGLGSGGGKEFFEYEWDAPVEEIDLSFNKPFLFIIRDKSSGEAWFVGTVYSPEELEQY